MEMGLVVLGPQICGLVTFVTTAVTMAPEAVAQEFKILGTEPNRTSFSMTEGPVFCG